MAEAEQQIDVGGPGADAVHRGQRRVGFVGRHGGERREVELAAIDAFAIALSVRIFGAESPARASLAERARSTAA